MNDRELLEKAARAAGIEVNRGNLRHERDMLFSKGVGWDPLDNDGDALRLMARLNICISYSDPDDGPEFVGAYEDWGGFLCREPGHGAYATRRAIVRAAAAMCEE